METTLHDGNIRKVADELHLVLEKLKEVEVLPHHFDYPLIDKFLDIELETNEVLEMSSMYVSFLLRLLQKCIEAKTVNNEAEPFASFFNNLHNFLHQGRPTFVLSAIFRLCSISLHLKEDWTEWAATNFSDAKPSACTMTVFIRNEIETIFKKIEDTNSIRKPLKILSEIFQNDPIVDSPFVLNSVARIAKAHGTFFEKEWDTQAIFICLLNRFYKEKGLDTAVFQYFSRHLDFTPEIIRVLNENPGFSITFWLSYYQEYVGLRFLRIIRYKKWPVYVDDFFLDNCSLEQLCDCFPYILERVSLDYILERDNLLPNKLDAAGNTSLQRFLQHLSTTATNEQFLNIVEKCAQRIANSSQLLSFLSKNIPEYLISERCPILRKALVDVVSKAFPSGKSGDDIEQLEHSLEVARITSLPIPVQINDDLLFHENEYVSTAALKCLLARRSTVDPFSDCVKVIEKGIHSSTKLIALEYLDQNFPQSKYQCMTVLEYGLEDDDNENRWKAFQIAKKLWNDAILPRETLERYMDDYLIGTEVRSLLSLPPPETECLSLKLLGEIISGLDMVYVDVPDCS